jgi:calpain-15
LIDDSWFLGAAAALAEQPSRVQKLFRNSEYSKDGIFEVIFNLRDQHVHVSFDDRLPLGSNGELINARPASKDSGWWLVLLEKAYAKLNVNYANLHHGSPVEALKELTGMPVSQYQTN